MDSQAIISELTEIIGGYLKIQGLNLVELICRHEGRGLFLRVLTDKPEGGISLSECARLNTEIGRILDERDTLGENYTLEVSSPGLDRPLSVKSDFLRCMNKMARFFLNQPIDGKRELEGLIAGADEEAVYIEREGKTLKVPLAYIAKAKQIIE